MTNHSKPAGEANATQILNKFILKRLRPKKVPIQRLKKSISLLMRVLMRSAVPMHPSKKYSCTCCLFASINIARAKWQNLRKNISLLKC